MAHGIPTITPLTVEGPDAQKKEEEEAPTKSEVEAEAIRQKLQKVEEARQRAVEEAEIQQKVQEEARIKAGEKALRKAEEEADSVFAELQRQAVEEARMKAEEEVRRKAQEGADAQQKAADEARISEEEVRRKAEEEAEAQQKAAEEARMKAEEEDRRKAEEEAKAQLKAEEEARMKAEEKAKAAEEARIRAEEEATRKAAEEAEAQRKAEEEGRIKAEEEAKAAEEARVKAEEEARRKAEEEAEAQRNVEKEASRKAEREAQEAKLKEHHMLWPHSIPCLIDDDLQDELRDAKCPFNGPSWLDSFVRGDPEYYTPTAGLYEFTPLEKPETDPKVRTDLSHMRREGSRTYLGPAAEAAKKDKRQGLANDEDMLRANSLSCLRDISGFVTEVESKSGPKPEYQSQHPDVPVVIVTSEVSPFSKTGGLALVCQCYGIEFPKRGHRTMVVSPMYERYPNVSFLGSTRTWLMGAETEVKFFHLAKEQGAGLIADYVFIDHPCYQRPGGLYCNADGHEYDDNLYRFSLLSLAALEATKFNIPCRPGPGSPYGEAKPYGQRVMFIANDWQTAMLPVYLVHQRRPRGDYTKARCLFVVHNFGYQGIYPLNRSPGVKNVGLEDLGLDPRFAWNALIYTYPKHERAYHDDDGHVLNLSKAALATADRILTVSPGYASEMKTVEGGFRLQGCVIERNFWLKGILNGIDVSQWNPMNDPLLAQNYGPGTDFVAARALCKKQLQERLNLKVDPNVALVAFVGRLAGQKGIDIILQAVDWLMTDTGNGVTGHVQLILMGHGEAHFGNIMRGCEQKYKGRVCGYVGFDPKVEHIIYAGSDLFLMPSRYEPCGLPQMYAMRYGCIPVVTLCGGLKDSVVIEPPSEATGFGILPLTLDKFKEVTYKALETFFRKKKEFREMQVRGMKKDFSWCRAMDEYEKQFDFAYNDKPYVK
eukprot:gnl/MRDRNA2_/MRDRNA2_79604_c0_seq3.p1 gnl/MRDRNA2_/MRDRNA2_79604_c0~~gnl/MRDRNA2_/MRDRNA2_79604_c0_seq3.p1  ORF type:complete len:961 (+),score=267.70 gnl/MRDRNA2_/MRDRNA2_79604_c0_seq3:71-2884(+)